MPGTIQVLIVEDDFRIADINRQFVELVDGFSVMEVVKTGKEALTFLRASPVLPRLILLDVYIPDIEGLELFWQLRKEFSEIDMIMITAAKEVETITETLRGGIFDYIVKPVDFERFKQTLLRFKQQTELLKEKTELEQAEIDRLTGMAIIQSAQEKPVEKLPKGIDQITLDKIRHVLQACGEPGITALEAGNEVGVSRSTARRYLEYLVSVHEADAKLKYGEVGRPERKYMPWTK